MGRIPESESRDRLEACRKMLADGLNLTDISARVNVDRTVLYRFLCRNGVITPKHGGNSNGILRRTTRRKAGQRKPGARPMGYNGEEWGKQKASASSLTPEQILHAFRLGINPERYAWLLTCPKGGFPHR